MKRLLRHAALILSLAGCSAAQGLAARSYTWLSTDRADFCRDVRSPPPVLAETSAYPQTPYDQQAGAEARGILQGYRDDSYLLSLFRSCPLVEATTSSECSAQLEEYLSSLLLFGSPIMAGLFFMFIWQMCCCTAMCRCCRRCCLCAERKAPYGVRLWQKMSLACLVPIGIVAGVAAVFVVYTRSETFTVAVQEVLCHSLTMADEALNGSPSGPLFLGIDAGIQRVALLQQLLDVDSKAMTDIRAILDETAPFGSAVDDLLAKVDHMKRVLTLVGQQKLKEHTCWFCIRAIGSNSTGEVGLLNELKLALQTSSADAMQSIRETTSATLTGQRLADVAAAAGRGRNALEVFKQATAGSFVETFLSYRYTLQTIEDARHTAFLALSGFTAVLVLLATPGSIVYARRSKATYPSASPSCASWFCSFCALTCGLLFAGGLLLVAIPMSELCHFWRYDLLTHGGISDYYRQIGLYNEADLARHIDPYATDVFRTCFTGNGTGNIIGALQLQDPLSFQQVLDEKFIELEDKQAAMVVDTARYELLVSQATLFGGLFLLEPDQPLALDPAWASKLLGSSLDPDDQVGPDGESLIYGLNTYASSIAGPGEYAFEHGTSGGGILITATEPSEASVSNLPLRTQNALAYARLKEQVLSEDRLLRCDVMDGNYVVTERFCAYEDFKVHVRDMAEQVRAAGMVLSTQANAAKELLATDLKSTLQSILMEVQQLRTLLGCRFLWRRWEDFDFTLCNVALPNAIECTVASLVLAVAALLLAFVHYKMWRHLLDNKVVGEELEKFSKKYGYLKTRK